MCAMPLFCLVAAWPKVIQSLADTQVQSVPLFSLVAAWPKVTQKGTDAHVRFVCLFRFVSVSNLIVIVIQLNCVYITLSSACTDHHDRFLFSTGSLTMFLLSCSSKAMMPFH